jgi:hypothetical protein
MGLKLINQQHSFRKQNTNLPQREKSQAHVHNVTEPMDATTGQPKEQSLRLSCEDYNKSNNVTEQMDATTGQPKEQKVSGSRAKTTIKGGEKKICFRLLRVAKRSGDWPRAKVQQARTFRCAPC